MKNTPPPPVIKRVEFLLSATSPEHYPEPTFPEIAFAGRSNVGKSSLLNRMVGRNKVARVSNTPGRTRQINFFEVTTDKADVRLVDLPGYGYAKVSKSERASWGPMM